MTRLAALTALLALGLAACGGSSDDQDAAAEPAPEPDPEPAAPAPPPADTPSGKPIMITEDFESALRVNTNQWATW